MRSRCQSWLCHIRATHITPLPTLIKASYRQATPAQINPHPCVCLASRCGALLGICKALHIKAVSLHLPLISAAPCCSVASHCTSKPVHFVAILCSAPLSPRASPLWAAQLYYACALPRPGRARLRFSVPSHHSVVPLIALAVHTVAMPRQFSASLCPRKSAHRHSIALHRNSMLHRTVAAQVRAYRCQAPADHSVALPSHVSTLPCPRHSTRYNAVA